MLKIILKREILHNLYSLRFLISLALLIGVFVAGSFSFIKGHSATMSKYEESQRQFQEAMQAQAQEGGTALAVTRRSYTLRPRDNAFIDDAKEKYLPNAVVFSAWNVFSFENKSGSANPFLVRFDELNWSFVAALIASFIALLFTFDAVSGEKESKTLALSLSNSISRATLLLGKYLSAILSTMGIVLTGVLVNLILVVSSGSVALRSALAGEVIGFLVICGLLMATFSAFGLFCSIAASNSNVSLLLALSFWLAVAVVIPNSSLFIAKKLYPIESSESVQKKVDTAADDLSKSAPPGSWMMMSGNPFLPQHRLRANLQMKLFLSEKNIRDAYYQAMFRQFEKARLVTSISPVSAFRFLAEAVVGGGYVRFRKAWEDFHFYQAQFLAFFKSLDAQDPKSPHWFNPKEDVSTTEKPVAIDTVPQFTEKALSFAERISPVLKYLMISIFMTCATFFLSYVLFVKYDAR